jgi:hypothetical protein
VKPAATYVALLVVASLLGGCASWGRPIGIPLRNKTRFESEWKGYRELPGYKALAVAGDLGATYVSGWTSEYYEQQKATADALKSCEERRRDRRIAGECRVYAIGDEIFQEGRR